MRRTVLSVVAVSAVLLASAGVSLAGPNCAMVKKDLSMGRTPDDIAERMMTTDVGGEDLRAARPKPGDRPSRNRGGLFDRNTRSALVLSQHHCGGLKDAIDETPPEIIADLMETGVCLAGGGAQLQALDRRLTDELHVRVWIAEDPMSCVARGAGMILENYDALRHLLVGLERGSTRHNQKK